MKGCRWRGRERGGGQQHTLPSTYYNIKHSSLINICCCSLSDTFHTQNKYNREKKLNTGRQDSHFQLKYEHIFLKNVRSVQRKKIDVTGSYSKHDGSILADQQQLTGKASVPQPLHRTPTYILYQFGVLSRHLLPPHVDIGW